MMRRGALAGLVPLAGLVLLLGLEACTGTTNHRAEWRTASVAGERCAEACRARDQRCAAECNGEQGCREACAGAVDDCYASCPDMEKGPSRAQYCAGANEAWTDRQCWQKGFCGRGECVIEDGCCVRR